MASRKAGNAALVPVIQSRINWFRIIWFRV